MNSAAKKSAVKAAKQALTTNEKKPTAALLAIFVGYAVLIAMTWVGIGKFAATRAIVDATHQAETWSHEVSRKFVFVQQTFKASELQIYDKNLLERTLRDQGIFRYTLLNADNIIFWSSRRALIGKTLQNPIIKAAKASGQAESRAHQVANGHVDGYITHYNSNGSPVRKTQRVAEIAVPIYYHKEFVGTMLVHSNVTWKSAMMSSNAKRIAAIITTILAVIFTGIAFLVWSFARSRTRQLIKLEKSRSEAVEMADQLKEMNNDIADLNVDLRENVTMLRETQDEVIRKGKMAQLGQLTATVAHDIRNPLGTISTSAFLLRRKFAKDNPKMEKPLDRIEKGVDRCDGIIKELLDFARSKALNLKSQNLDQWLLHLLQEQLPQLPEQVAIEYRPGLDDTEFNFDSDSMSRAIINFLSNAAEAMVGKGSEAPMEPTQNPKIILATRRTERGIEISVTDNGPGISEENLKKILNPLFTTKSFGVGLGLPAVEKIFEQHCGGLEIKSKEGQGATFTGWFSIEKLNANCSGAQAA